MRKFTIEVDGWQVNVRVYATRRGMVRGIKGKGLYHEIQEEGMGVVGQFSPYERVSYRTGRKEVKPDYGNLFLNMEHVGIGIVAHELCHATMAHPGVRKVLRKKGSCDYQGCFVSRYEEYFCEVLGELVRKFWVEWYEPI